MASQRDSPARSDTDSSLERRLQGSFSPILPTLMTVRVLVFTKILAVGCTTELERGEWKQSKLNATNLCSCRDSAFKKGINAPWISANLWLISRFLKKLIQTLPMWFLLQRREFSEVLNTLPLSLASSLLLFPIPFLVQFFKLLLSIFSAKISLQLSN